MWLRFLWMLNCYSELLRLLLGLFVYISCLSCRRLVYLALKHAGGAKRLAAPKLKGTEMSQVICTVLKTDP